MNSADDSSQFSEYELIELFGRIDPRFAPEHAAQIKERLTQLGYVVRDGDKGPGFVYPSSEKLKELIGSTQPIECRVTFGAAPGILDRFQSAQNDFGLVGSGSLTFDGIHLMLSARRGATLFGFCSSRVTRATIARLHIVNAERIGAVLHLVERIPGSADRAITLWTSDEAIATQLVEVLPRTPTTSFSPQLQRSLAFHQLFYGRSVNTPATIIFLAINILVFFAAVFDGANWISPLNSVQIEWGSNFGPYTTDGDWWRLVVALFIHFGAIHLIFNMWALVIVGPLVERLFGSVVFAGVFIAGGVIGNLVSIAWHPAINTAGSSSAIFALIGAFFAALLLTGDTIPHNIVKRLSISMTIFCCIALVAGFLNTGIDNAAHLGGLGGGFLIGLCAAQPLARRGRGTMADIRQYLQALALAAALVGGGVWLARRTAGSLEGDGLFWNTMHLFRRIAPASDSEFNLALDRAKANPQLQGDLSDQLDRNIVPSWRRLAAQSARIILPPDSPNLPQLQFLQAVADGRLRGFELFADALHKKSAKELWSAQRELKAVDDMISRLRDSTGPTQQSLPK